MDTVTDIGTTVNTLDALRDHLISQAELFEEPTTYCAGVLDTIEALRQGLVRSEVSP